MIIALKDGRREPVSHIYVQPCIPPSLFCSRIVEGYEMCCPVALDDIVEITDDPPPEPQPPTP
jgi:hypothetical protein